MKLFYSMLLAGMIVATSANIAIVTAAGAAAEQGPGAYPMDCAKWNDKARCAALNKDIQACRDKTDDEWRECMHRPAPTAKFTPPKPRDCSKARNKEGCDSHSSALEACKDKRTRAEHRKCMAGQSQASAPKKN
jgi:predicted secreted protein